MKFICKKCGSTDYKIIEKSNGKGIATGLYCAKCGQWQKWLNKQEKALFADDIKDNRIADKDNEIARLTAENAELIARLEKAMEALDYACWEMTLLGICCQGCGNEDVCDGSFSVGGYALKKNECKKYWLTKAEQTLAELQEEEK